MAKTTTTAPEYRAEAKFQRVSPQKAKLVLDLIKGKPVGQAINIVAFTNKRIAPVIEKTLRSAVQNAQYLSDERGLDVDVDKLYVKSAVANDGPRMKRIRPAPMGRAFRYVRRIAHIEIALAERGKNGAAGLATVVGEEQASAPEPAKKKRAVAKKKSIGKKAVAKK
jgi:large subunit ribosomal protein L22